jgi:hypothetical protein
VDRHSTCCGVKEIKPNVCFGSWLRENSEIEFANGNFVSTSINLKNKSAGDGCRDKTIEKTILRAFRARTFSRSLGQKLKGSRRADVFCSSLNNGHQDHNLVPIGGLVAFDHRSGSFCFFKTGILACE